VIEGQNWVLSLCLKDRANSRSANEESMNCSLNDPLATTFDWTYLDMQRSNVLLFLSHLRFFFFSLTNTTEGLTGIISDMPPL
jgi:hypothetical protein